MYRFPLAVYLLGVCLLGVAGYFALSALNSFAANMSVFIPGYVAFTVLVLIAWSYLVSFTRGLVVKRSQIRAPQGSQE